MATLHGAPLPKDFEDNNPLTAADFNAVKNYWVADALPEYDPDDPDSVEIQDGDVVFVIGDSPVDVSGGLPGLGGWTHINKVESPTNDIAPYEADGITWKAYSWENPKVLSSGNSETPTRDLMGSVTLAEKGLVQVLIVAGGGSGFSNAGGGGAGGVIATVLELPKGKNDIYVGSGSRSTTPGGGSSVGPIGIAGGSYRTPGDSGNGFNGYSHTTPGAGAGGNAYFNYDPGYNKVAPGPGITLNWEDGVTDVVYGYGGDYSTSTAQPPGYGDGGTMQPSSNTGYYNPGANGFVLIRVPQEYALNTSVTAMSDETRKRAQAEADFEAERQRAQADADFEAERQAAEIEGDE